MTFRGRVLAELLRGHGTAEAVCGRLHADPEHWAATTAEVQAVLRSLHRDGHVEVHAINDGVTTYRVTETGMALLALGLLRHLIEEREGPGST